MNERGTAPVRALAGRVATAAVVFTRCLLTALRGARVLARADVIVADIAELMVNFCALGENY